MSETTSWAIVDVAAEPDLFLMLEELDPPHASLYAEPIPEEIGRSAPHLVRADEAVIQWLELRETPWRIQFESRANIYENAVSAFTQLFTCSDSRGRKAGTLP